MKWLFVLLVTLVYAEPCVVFVHIGPELPSYLGTAVAQARLFNPQTPIYVLANEAALKHPPEEFEQNRTLCVPCEKIPKGSLHQKFLKQSKLNQGLWSLATERFFYLADLMQEYQLGDVFHLETDVLLYVGLETLLPTFKKHYTRTMGATFDNDKRCIAGLFYVPHLRPLNCFLEFVAERAKQQSDGNDMVFLGQFKEKYLKQYIESLPIIMPEYAAEHPLVSANGLKGSRAEEFTNHSTEFNSLFDAAAIGQYLGGEFHRKEPGFLNESCVFSPAHLRFEWEKDSQGRKVPFAIYKEKRWRVNNLHIHSKQLKEFYSR